MGRRLSDHQRELEHVRHYSTYGTWWRVVVACPEVCPVDPTLHDVDVVRVVEIAAAFGVVVSSLECGCPVVAIGVE